MSWYCVSIFHYVWKQQILKTLALDSFFFSNGMVDVFVWILWNVSKQLFHRVPHYLFYDKMLEYFFFFFDFEVASNNENQSLKCYQCAKCQKGTMKTIFISKFLCLYFLLWTSIFLQFWPNSISNFLYLTFCPLFRLYSSHKRQYWPHANSLPQDLRYASVIWYNWLRQISKTYPSTFVCESFCN